MFNVGPAELMIILVLALIIFGPKKLPEMGKSIGKGLREFRAASTEIRRELSEGLNERAPAPGSPETNGGGSPDGAASSEGTSAAIAPETSSGGATAPHPPAPPAPPSDQAPGA